jgi:amidase
VQISGTPGGDLAGLRFAAKDIYDIAGHVTGCGNPTWLATHAPATTTASSVQKLLDAGADLVGKTHTNELAYSVTGENTHYGTPKNVNAPGRVPGGSSSGSASAVAGGLVDFALGSDTGGSVRIPASFCGIYGLRPTHGRIAADGIMPLAPSFDTVGWFTRDAELLRRVGQVLLPGVQSVPRARRLLVAKDTFDFLPAPVGAALAPALDRVCAAFDDVEEISASGGSPADWLPHFRVLQAREVWQCHGDWVRTANPDFGPGVRERFEAAALIRDDEVAASTGAREALRQRLDGFLTGATVICLPTAPGIAPLCGTPEPEMDGERQRILSLTCLSGLSGCPQVTLPLATLDRCPLGLSLLAARGQDETLLDLAVELSST